MKKNIILIFYILLTTTVFSQVTGVVSSHHDDSHHHDHNFSHSLPNATVFWQNTQIATTTNADGEFSINRTNLSDKLIINYVGFKPDTIIVNSDTNINVVLKEDANIEKVVINHKQNGNYTSKNSNLYTKKISSTGLTQLPCCNLSESFENSADVDVSFSDAVSGAKKIQMLGLAGVYTQILTENIPSIRGLSTAYGLAFIPGPWMESIQVSKGTATVINGYESISGQINIELKKPQKSEKLHLNLFGNSHARAEFNANTAFKLNDKLSTMFLVHGSTVPIVFDYNNDGFADLPLTKQFNILNRWNFENHKGMHSQIGLKVMMENRSGGQMDYLNSTENTGFYGIGINTHRYEAFYRLGSPINFIKGASVGSTFSVLYHNQNSFYGNNNYDGIEKSFYGNIIFEKELFSHNHKLNFGTSLLLDDYKQVFNEQNFDRNEIVPGVFAQYTYQKHEKISAILGYRADFHNIFGSFQTLRSHLKYFVTENTVLRASAGKGYRIANIFAENTAIMVSNREFFINDNLNPEEAWNYGLSITHDFEFSGSKKISVAADYFRTDFVNQVIIDVDANVNQALIYNLTGKSFSNSYQVDVNIDLVEGLNIYSAARYNDVKVTMHDELIEKPLVSKFKGLVTISYSTRHDKWTFDFSNQVVGPAKLPNTTNNPAEFQLQEYSPTFYILHGQVTRKFKHFEIYVGGENLTNYTQKQPIIDSANPFAEYFDASIIWGPIVGRTLYAGVRFTLK